MTLEELRKKARNVAYQSIFAGAERDSNWPMDPERFLTRAVLAHKKVSDIAEINTDGEAMYTWEPCEDWLVSDLVDLLDDITATIIAEFREVAINESKNAA